MSVSWDGESGHLVRVLGHPRRRWCEVRVGPDRKVGTSGSGTCRRVSE